MSDAKDKGKATQRAENEAEEVGAARDAESTGKGFQSPALLRESPTNRRQNHAGSPSPITKKLPPKAIESIIEMNPALKNELAAMDPDQAAEALSKLDISQLLTGLTAGGKNQKDMASYKFWQTQPVPTFDDQASKKAIAQGPIKVINPDEVPKTPDALIEGFEWCTLDLTDPVELKELYELLNNHYVEDDNAMFRFSYSESFLHWYDDPHAIYLAACCF